MHTMCMIPGNDIQLCFTSAKINLAIIQNTKYYLLPLKKKVF